MSFKETLVQELSEIGDAQRIILATGALGMGVNIPSVRWVVMLGNPTSVLDMVQMIGRAGRDKQPSRATLMLLHDSQVHIGWENLVTNSNSCCWLLWGGH